MPSARPDRAATFGHPRGTAAELDGEVVLNARKSWVTSASHATAYVWSSCPLAAEGVSTIWLIPAKVPGLTVPGPFEGLGLRGNDSCPVSANGVTGSRAKNQTYMANLVYKFSPHMTWAWEWRRLLTNYQNQSILNADIFVGNMEVAYGF